MKQTGAVRGRSTDRKQTLSPTEGHEFLNSYIPIKFPAYAEEKTPHATTRRRVVFENAIITG